MFAADYFLYSYQNHRKFSLNFVDFFEKVRIIIFRMDTKRNQQIAGRDALARMTGRQVVVGVKQLRKALLSDKARLVCLAENAEPALTEPIEALCQQKNVEYAWVASMTDLGRACGIEVGAAAAAAVD